MDAIRSSAVYVWIALALLLVTVAVRRPADTGWTPIPCRRSFPCAEGRSEPPLPVDVVEDELRRQQIRPQLEARREIERVYRELVELERKINRALDAVVAAQTKAERDSAAVSLKRLRQWKAELEDRIHRLKVAAKTSYRCGSR